MGRIGKILSFIRTVTNNANSSNVKINTGGGYNLTCEHYADAGDDSFPLQSDYVATIVIPRSGSHSAIGYLDPKNERKANVGDKRIYARDSNGDTIAEVWLKNDGTIITSNSNGNIELKPDGTITNTNAGGSTELKPNGDYTINGTNVIINASTKFTVNSPESEFSAIVNSLGKFSALLFGGLGTNPMTTNVNLETSADVKAGSISLLNHTHTSNGVGNETSSSN